MLCMFVPALFFLITVYTNTTFHDNVMHIFCEEFREDNLNQHRHRKQVSALVALSLRMALK